MAQGKFLMSDLNLAIQRQIQGLQVDVERIRKADTGLSAGTAFPSTPGTGLLFFRSDLGLLCYYDGTRWLTVHEYDVIASYLATFSGTPAASAVSALRTDYAPWFTRVVILTSVATTNNAGNFWTVTLQGLDITGASTTNIYQINTGATPDVVGTRTNHEGTAGATPANRALLRVLMTSTGAPGNIELTATAFYRLIVT